MQNTITRPLAALLLGSLLFTACQKDPPFDDKIIVVDETKLCTDHCPSLSTVTVFAEGLNNPRGLKFGPDGNLYVAEGGIGGTNSTADVCPDLQIAPPGGPHTGSLTGGGISIINSSGQRTVLTDQLPTSQTSPDLGSLISGVSDVAFIGHNLYALLGGAGCSHGVAEVPNGIVRVKHDGAWDLVANLSEWLLDNPAENPGEDFEPEGTWYSMVAAYGKLFALEPNQGILVRATPGGHVEQVVDISATQGHIVPTALVHHPHSGNFYVGNLNPFPIEQGSSTVYKITPNGEIREWVKGLTTILGLEFDHKNRLYVLENTTGNPFPTPGTGRILRISQGGKVEVIATGLNLPTAMTFGPDGNLYVSNWGFGPPAVGGGQVLKVKLHH